MESEFAIPTPAVVVLIGASGSGKSTWAERHFKPGQVSTLTDIALAAEEVGFRALWVMDHFRQVPQVGRAWEPMLEAYTTLAWLAALTERLRLGTLVTNVEHRNVGLLAKIVATLDVLSGGRAECGLVPPIVVSAGTASAAISVEF